jgi:hypothetical protein
LAALSAAFYYLIVHVVRPRQIARQRFIEREGTAGTGTVVRLNRVTLGFSAVITVAYTPAGGTKAIRANHIVYEDAMAQCANSLPRAGSQVHLRYLPSNPRLVVIPALMPKTAV